MQSSYLRELCCFWIYRHRKLKSTLQTKTIVSQTNCVIIEVTVKVNDIFKVDLWIEMLKDRIPLSVVW